MDYHLRVVSPFGDCALGDTISDPNDIAAVLRDNPGFVIRVAARVGAAPAPAAVVAPPAVAPTKVSN